MHFSRRDEPFRYIFPEPLDGKFRITKIDGTCVESHFGKMKIIDLSLSGAKITVEFNLHAEWREVEITIHFTIMNREFSISGFVVYQDSHLDGMAYGIQLQTDEVLRSQLVEELKAFAWHLVEEEKR